MFQGELNQMFIYQNGRRIWTELQEADGGGNNGGGEGGNTNTIEAAFQRLLDRNKNDGVGLAEKLFTENYTYREKVRQLEGQVTELTGKVPAAGAVVLSGDDVAAWQAYQTLGKPEEIKQGLDERTKIQGDLATKERELLLRNVADAAGYKPTVLSNLDRIAKVEGKELSYDIRDVTADGKTEKVVYVKEGDKELSIAEYATTNWSDYLPSLAVQLVETQQQSGTRYVTQHASSNGAEKQTTKTIAQQTLNKAYASREDKK